MKLLLSLLLLAVGVAANNQALRIILDDHDDCPMKECSLEEKKIVREVFYHEMDIRIGRRRNLRTHGRQLYSQYVPLLFLFVIL